MSSVLHLLRMSGMFRSRDNVLSGHLKRGSWGAHTMLWHVQLKETLQDKLMSDEALEERRREEEEKRKAEARKKRWGPFGIFPGGK